MVGKMRGMLIMPFYYSALPEMKKKYLPLAESWM